MKQSHPPITEKEPDPLSTANLQSYNDAVGETKIDRQTQMERNIKHETGLSFERGLSKYHQIDQLAESDASLAMSAAKAAVQEQSAEHWQRLTNRVYGHPPTQSVSPMEHFCIVTPVDDPKPTMAQESLETAGIKPGFLEHTEIRSQAAEKTATFPVMSPSTSTPKSEEGTATALEADLHPQSGGWTVEVDAEENEADLRPARPSFRNTRQSPQETQPRVLKKMGKRKRDNEEDEGDDAKRRRSSSTSMKVHVDSRSSSEERLAGEGRRTYQDAPSTATHGIGGWTSPERDT